MSYDGHRDEMSTYDDGLSDGYQYHHPQRCTANATVAKMRLEASLP